MGDRRVSYPEDDVGKRVDRCFTDALIKGCEY